jgi:lipopolysaccharide transport system ATP-binding protein
MTIVVPALHTTAPTLIATGLGKRYQRDCTPTQQLSNLLFGAAHGAAFWALQPVTLQVGRSEALGVIGRNGSGKSTLLQLLMGTLTPSVGQVTRQGQVAGLLELGAGFNPDFTGRENAIFNATSLGLSPELATERMPLIEAFAEIGGYIDRPVREYSSGMYARLAFAVAIHVDAEVLIVDEILSVGDSLFQHRCHAWMRNFRADGGSIVFVSQNAIEMSSICQRAIWLDQGEVRADGPSDEVAAAYQAAMLGQYGDIPAASRSRAALGAPDAMVDDARFDTPMAVQVGPFLPKAPQHGQGGARIVNVTWHQPDGPPVTHFAGGEEIELRLEARAETNLDQPILGFIFRDSRGQNVFGDNSYLATAQDPPAVGPGGQIAVVFRFRFPYLPTGTYQLAPSILDGTQDNHAHIHWLEEAMQINVTESPVSFGLVGVPMIDTSLGPCD